MPYRKGYHLEYNIHVYMTPRIFLLLIPAVYAIILLQTYLLYNN